MCNTKVVEKIRAHMLCSITFSPLQKSHRLRGNVEKYYRAGQATDDNKMAHADFVPDN